MKFKEKKLIEFFLQKGIEILFDFKNKSKFQNSDEVFKDTNGNIYTVNDLITNTKNLIKFIEINFDINLYKYKRVLNILKLVILFLNNQQYQKPKKDDVIECIKTIMELENRNTEEINSVIIFIHLLSGVSVNE